MVRVIRRHIRTRSLVRAQSLPLPRQRSGKPLRPDENLAPADAIAGRIDPYGVRREHRGPVADDRDLPLNAYDKSPERAAPMTIVRLRKLMIGPAGQALEQAATAEGQ